MRDWQIAADSDDSATGCDLVRQWLREHNWAANDALSRPQITAKKAKALERLTRAGAPVLSRKRQAQAPQGLYVRLGLAQANDLVPGLE